MYTEAMRDGIVSTGYLLHDSPHMTQVQLFDIDSAPAHETRRTQNSGGQISTMTTTVQKVHGVTCHMSCPYKYDK
ncbi:unnamed protein product [Arctia plantaginis]|uniref:Uncharacterized protein n=1 Tax=Arctia plantaginis TaxID=874455 RepID=A0A8S1AEE0_ARCPL|nr:unnamed protein product [Arctia plantaginis]